MWVGWWATRPRRPRAVHTARRAAPVRRTRPQFHRTSSAALVHPGCREGRRGAESHTVPRFIPKLHRPWPGGRLPVRANSSLVQRNAETTTRAPQRQAVTMWTRPADRVDKAMDKCTALAHPLPTLAALAPTSPPLLQQRSMEKATAPAPAGSRITPSSQEIRLRNTPTNSRGDPTRECEKQQQRTAGETRRSREYGYEMAMATGRAGETNEHVRTTRYRCHRASRDGRDSERGRTRGDRSGGGADRAMLRGSRSNRRSIRTRDRASARIDRAGTREARRYSPLKARPFRGSCRSGHGMFAAGPIRADSGIGWTRSARASIGRGSCLQLA